MRPDREDLASQLAREIRAAVAEASPPVPASATALDAGEEDLRVPLRRAEEYLTPTIPQAVRFARGKSFVLRLLRFLWRDQTSFNALLLEASSGVVATVERNRRRFD